MRTALLALLVTGICISCNNTKKDGGPVQPDTAGMEKPSFFPVTSYLRGQLRDFASRGINPILYTTVNHRTDSSWLKVEQVDSIVKDFLRPVIDSANLVSLFAESKFKDQSINSYTFTYEPKGTLPDSMQLQRWDVYVDAETGKVKKIYLLKKISPVRDLQLTWQSDKSCSIVTVETAADGSSSVVREERINWDL